MVNFHKKVILLFIFIVLSSTSLFANTSVNVGGYIFPPFVDKTKDGEICGITIDMIKALNSIQDEFLFQFVLTSSRRRYMSFEKKDFDMIFFENIHWGWENQCVKSTKGFLKGEEVFIALKKKAKNQEYFNSLENKSIIGMYGYHYAFANFNSDPDFLKSNFNIYLTNNLDKNIKLVLKERVDIAIVTKSYLDKYLELNSSDKSKLIISNKIDQEYNHTILVRQGSSPDVAKMNILLDKLIQTREFEKILKKYGIFYADSDNHDKPN